MNADTFRYRVNVKSSVVYPAVGTDGVMTRSVTFHIEPLDNGIPFDLDGGIVGGETLSRCHQLQSRGNVTVEFPSKWMDSRPANWQQEIVNVAFQEVANG
jgi:hypothetical protein